MKIKEEAGSRRPTVPAGGRGERRGQKQKKKKKKKKEVHADQRSLREVAENAEGRSKRRRNTPLAFAFVSFTFFSLRSLRPPAGTVGLREPSSFSFSSSLSAQKEGLHIVSVETMEEEPIISSGWPPAAEAALDVASQ